MRLLDVVLYTVALPTPSTSSYTHADHVPVGRPGSLSETNLAVARGMMCRDTNGLSLLPPQLLQPLPSILRSDLLSLSLPCLSFAGTLCIICFFTLVVPGLTDVCCRPWRSPYSFVGFPFVFFCTFSYRELKCWNVWPLFMFGGNIFVRART